MDKQARKMEEELRKLALLSDDEIDTSDISETTDWSLSSRPLLRVEQLERRNYDVRAVANWFIERLNQANIRITNLSLNKLVYFAIERFIMERCVLLTEARVEAWDYGPVVREIYNPFKKRGGSHISEYICKYSIQERKMVTVTDNFDFKDLDLFEDLCLSYGLASASRLVTLSHIEGGAWHKVWTKSLVKNPGMVITPEIIINYAPVNRQING